MAVLSHNTFLGQLGLQLGAPVTYGMTVGLKKLESLGTMVKCALVLTHYQRVMDGHAACSSQVTLYT